MAQDFAVRIKLHRDAVRKVDEMTEQRDFFSPVHHALAVLPVNMMETDEPGQVRKRRESSQQGISRQGVAIRLRHFELECLHPGLARQSADIMYCRGQDKPFQAVLVQSQRFAEGGGDKRDLFMMVHQHRADQVGGG